MRADTGPGVLFFRLPCEIFRSLGNVMWRKICYVKCQAIYYPLSANEQIRNYLLYVASQRIKGISLFDVSLLDLPESLFYCEP